MSSLEKTHGHTSNLERVVLSRSSKVKLAMMVVERRERETMSVPRYIYMYLNIVVLNKESDRVVGEVGKVLALHRQSD